MTIERCTEASDELLVALNHLLPQLSSSAQPLTLAQVETIVGAAANTFFIARHEGRIVGTLTLATFPILTGLRAWIEDVVVDDSVRGLGYGAALTNAAVERARELGATTVDLTSRPARVAANRLYQKCGFVARETNVYRFSLD
jgi:GNAT superfamily N-acetyltransferase